MMQNLPIQLSQPPVVKSGSVEAVSKVEGANPAPNQSFQSMLSQQVQTKQAAAKQNEQRQADGKQAQNQPPANGAKPAQASASPAAPKPKSDASSTKSAEQADTAHAKPAAEDGVASKKPLIDADALTGKDKEADTKPGEAVTAAPDPTLAGQLGLPVIAANAGVSGSATGSEEKVAADGIGGRQFNPLDTALNNALSQGKTAASDSTAKLEADGAQNISAGKDNGKVSADNSRWLESVMPNALKQTAGDELATTRLAGASGKDIAIKDIAPLPTYQPLANANSLQAAQQIGSSNVINATPGKTGWDEAIGQKVVWMVGSGEQSATLTLNPPDMGPLQVVIHVHNDQADTTFISDNPEVRQALENGLSVLRDKMSDSGIQLGQTNISSGGQAQQEFQRANQNRSTSQPGSSSRDADAAPAERIAGSSTLVRVANGLVDTFA